MTIIKLLVYDEVFSQKISSSIARSLRLASMYVTLLNFRFRYSCISPSYVNFTKNLITYLPDAFTLTKNSVTPSTCDLTAWNLRKGVEGLVINEKNNSVCTLFTFSLRMKISKSRLWNSKISRLYKKKVKERKAREK